jgi:hypothetical protein
MAGGLTERLKRGVMSADGILAAVVPVLVVRAEEGR